MEQKEIVAEEKVIDKSTGVGILIVDQSHGICAKVRCRGAKILSGARES